MGKKSKRNSAGPVTPAAPAAPAIAVDPTTAGPEPFAQRHPTASKLIFAAVCIYIAMLWLLALDQTFHWGIFDPKVPPMP